MIWLLGGGRSQHMQVRSQEGSQSEMEPRTSSTGSGSHEVGIGDAEPVSEISTVGGLFSRADSGLSHTRPGVCISHRCLIGSGFVVDIHLSSYNWASPIGPYPPPLPGIQPLYPISWGHLAQLLICCDYSVRPQPSLGWKMHSSWAWLSDTSRVLAFFCFVCFCFFNHPEIIPSLQKVAKIKAAQYKNTHFPPKPS